MTLQVKKLNVSSYLLFQYRFNVDVYEIQNITRTLIGWDRTINVRYTLIGYDGIMLRTVWLAFLQFCWAFVSAGFMETPLAPCTMGAMAGINREQTVSTGLQFYKSLRHQCITIDWLLVNVHVIAYTS